jgi:hypothetical protein
MPFFPAIWSCAARPAGVRRANSIGWPRRGGRGAPTPSCCSGKENLMIARSVQIALVMLLWTPLAIYGDQAADTNRVVEIRSYNLKPGTRRQFHERFERDLIPMLKRWKVDVVAYGPSTHDDNSWFLMRAFSSVEARQKSEDAFYGSDEWRNGPRDAVLGDIDSYTTIVLTLDDAAVRGLRKLNGARR